MNVLWLLPVVQFICFAVSLFFHFKCILLPLPAHIMHTCSSSTLLPALNLQFTMKYMKYPGVVLSPVLSGWSLPTAWCPSVCSTFWVSVMVSLYSLEMLREAWLHFCFPFVDSDFLMFFSFVCLFGLLVWRPRTHFLFRILFKIGHRNKHEHVWSPTPFSQSLPLDALLQYLNFVVVRPFLHAPDYSFSWIHPPLETVI